MEKCRFYHFFKTCAHITLKKRDNNSERNEHITRNQRRSRINKKKNCAQEKINNRHDNH